MGRVCMVRDLVAELVMSRVCYGPSLSWAEFVMGRDVPESVTCSRPQRTATRLRLEPKTSRPKVLGFTNPGRFAPKPFPPLVV